MNFRKLVDEFVVRRAFRAGKITRSDLDEAFAGAFSATRISQKLTEIASGSPWVERRGKAVMPIDGVPVPAFAGEADLLHAILNGRDDFAFTGLRPHELPIQKCDWVQNEPVREGDFLRIAEALVQKRVIEVCYASLHQHDLGKVRKLAPVGLERMGDQWRLIAFDIEKPDQIPRAYVLARILEVRPLEKKIPKKLIHLGFGGDESYKIRLNHQLTNIQRKAMENELKIKNGVLRMQESHCFQFLRRYGDIEVSEGSVWPIIDRMDKE